MQLFIIISIPIVSKSSFRSVKNYQSGLWCKFFMSENEQFLSKIRNISKPVKNSENHHLDLLIYSI